MKLSHLNVLPVIKIISRKTNITGISSLSVMFKPVKEEQWLVLRCKQYRTKVSDGLFYSQTLTLKDDKDIVGHFCTDILHKLCR